MAQAGKAQNAATTPGALPVGSKLGKYEIVEQLGAGGQAIVYKGYDALLDRHVAIKQISPQLAAEDAFIERFREVARQLAKLDCEHIVTLHDLIEDPAGLFVVMEFVEGHSIETTLAQNPGPVEARAVLQIIWRIAAGLATIHKAGIIHRDLKPGNIIIGEGLRVKITDFGVAARAGSPASMRLGTTKYMAPELFGGWQADERVDIYSLGMIAYEMLLGRAKFKEVFQEIVRDPHSEALRWMKWHSSPQELAPPLSEVGPNVPPALSAIVERMMAKDPDDRFASVEELGREIRASFSPRSGRTVEEVHKGRRLSLEGAAVAESRAALAGAGGDDLTAPAVTAEESAEPATAEIPKVPMSRRKKIALVGVLTGIVMAGLITALVLDKIKQGRLTREAYGLYSDAKLVYEDAARAESAAEKRDRFAAAEKAFENVMNAYRGKARVVASQAGVMWYLCKAQQSVLAGDTRATGQELKAAQDLNSQLQATRSELAEWTRRMEKELDDFWTYWVQQREYAAVMQKAVEARQLGKLEEALAVLNEKARKLAVMAEQVREVEDLRQSIREDQKQQEFRAEMNRAEDLASKGNVDGALAAYQKALEVLEGGRAILPQATYQKLKQEAERDTLTLRTDTEYAKVIAQAKKAERSKSLLAAADAYEAAYKLKPDPKLQEKARDLRHDHYLAAGLAHMGTGRIREAETALKKAQSYKSSAAVESALKKLQGEKDFRRLVGEGDRLFREKNYEGALERYQSASRFKTDGALRGKIAECSYHLALAKAEGFRAEKKWREARKQYQVARRAKPDRSAEISARLSAMQKEEIYFQYLDEAEQAHKKGEYLEAVAKLKLAREQLATQEVEQKIKQVRYEEHREKGKQAMDSGEYSSAVAYFRMAKGFLATPEIDDLIGRAQQLKEESEGE